MQEWNEHENEYSESAQEYTERGSEYFELPPEYPEIGTVSKEDMAGKAKKNTRKMVYMVAAALSVTTIGQTLTLQEDKAPVAEQEVENKVDSSYEFEWPKVPGLDGTYGEGTKANDGNETEGRFPEGMLYLDEYEGFGYSNGGAVPVIIDGKWGMVDLNGNPLVTPGFTSFWMSPNEDGYAIFQDENGDYCVVGKDGKWLSYDSEVRNLCIGEDNVISFKEYDEDAQAMRFVYHHEDGSVLCETPWRMNHELSMANAFRNGKAYATYCITVDDLTWLTLNEISFDGTITECMNQLSMEEAYRESGRDDGTVVDIAVYGAYDGYSDGVFVGTAPGFGGGVCLVSPQSGKATNWITFVTIPEYGIEQEHVFDLNYYRSHGMDMMHSGSIGCMSIKSDSGERKDILFDFNACSEEETLYEYIACHDTITFDDYRYLAAEDGGKSFYIDLAGNVVSGTYADATAFNDKGYALVLDDEAQTAHIIDDTFREVQTFPGIDSISLNDQMFVIHYMQENADQYQAGTYGFYYGE